MLYLNILVDILVTRDQLKALEIKDLELTKYTHLSEIKDSD